MVLTRLAAGSTAQAVLRFISLAIACAVGLVGCSNKYVGPGDPAQAIAGMPASAAGSAAAPVGGVSGATSPPSSSAGAGSGAGGAAGTVGAGNGGSSGSGPAIDPLPGAGSGGEGPDPAPDGSVPGRPRMAITADFLNKTLSFIDLDALREGGTRADALIGELDLSMYAPGPMSLNVTPDGKTALVSISGGFLGAFITVPAGPGTLLFVDVETRKVTGELDVGDSPMGIVFSPDSKRAFVGLYSENYFEWLAPLKPAVEDVRFSAGLRRRETATSLGSVWASSFPRFTLERASG
jgi:hypothetical protein